MSLLIAKTASETTWKFPHYFLCLQKVIIASSLKHPHKWEPPPSTSSAGSWTVRNPRVLFETNWVHIGSAYSTALSFPFLISFLYSFIKKKEKKKWFPSFFVRHALVGTSFHQKMRDEANSPGWQCRGRDKGAEKNTYVWSSRWLRVRTWGGIHGTGNRVVTLPLFQTEIQFPVVRSLALHIASRSSYPLEFSGWFSVGRYSRLPQRLCLRDDSGDNGALSKSTRHY